MAEVRGGGGGGARFASKVGSKKSFRLFRAWNWKDFQKGCPFI